MIKWYPPPKPTYSYFTMVLPYYQWKTSEKPKTKKKGQKKDPIGDEKPKTKERPTQQKTKKKLRKDAEPSGPSGYEVPPWGPFL